MRASRPFIDIGEAESTVIAYADTPSAAFVECGRFAGTSYKAANWIHVGQTKGRGKLDRNNERALPVKDIYLYPLHRGCRRIITAPL